MIRCTIDITRSNKVNCLVSLAELSFSMHSGEWRRIRRPYVHRSNQFCKFFDMGSRRCFSPRFSSLFHLLLQTLLCIDQLKLEKYTVVSMARILEQREHGRHACFSNRGNKEDELIDTDALHRRLTFTQCVRGKIQGEYVQRQPSIRVNS